ncbi:MAG: LysM peptidoglycan-binding domain-containing protein [Bacteroidaceae bacterium]|nr:LysM peptidoglycan-binding domain-containing protein [Bacteroidaceae bacterium]
MIKVIGYRLSIIAVFLFIGISVWGQTRHEIKAGETLYSISRTYGVTISAIQAANPGLGETIMAGQTINIPAKAAQEPQQHIIIFPETQPTQQQPVQQMVVPLETQQTVEPVVQQQTVVLPVAESAPVVTEIPPCKETYEVKKKETLYSIAQRFGVTVDEIVAANPTIEPDKKDRIKKGQVLCIPFTQAELEAMRPVEVEEEEIVIKEPVPVNFAVIMPFGLDQQKKTREAITMIDFYEGIMMAVSEMKKDGVSGKVYAYDEAQIDSVLALPQMKNVQLIIGAKDANNINKLKAFTEKNNISLVVPLLSSTTLVNNTHNVYQVNQKMDNDTYDRAFASFSAMHTNANYIFVNIEDQTDKADYMMRLKNYLNSEEISYFNCDFQNIGNIIEMLTTNKENYIIPSSSTKTAFDRLVKRLNELALDSYRINLFGYTDWQAFADKSIEAFKKYNCMFFTSFYNNPNATETYAFNQRFRSTFGRDQYNTYPRYGMLGYDIANFFVRNMYVEGEDFAANIENLTSEAIQNPMHFTHKNTWSGFINNAMMFVKYNSDGTISVKQL